MLQKKYRKYRYIPGSISGVLAAALIVTAVTGCGRAVEEENASLVNVEDKALIAFSRALKRSLAYKNAVAARWGGDEFVIAGKEKDMTRDFRELLKEALSLAELPYTPRFSMGTFICTFAGTSCDEAIAHADEELYKDKEKNHQESEGFIENLKKLNI